VVMKACVQGFLAGFLCLGWVMLAGAVGDVLVPPGAPAPSLRTLSQVEPRTPISSAGLIITAPGSYYLTTNLFTAANGITIRTNDVTLDLMGFAITGDRDATDVAVRLDGTVVHVYSGIVVRNGTLANCGYGVYADNVQGCRFENLTVVSNKSDGVLFYGESSGSRCNENTLSRSRVAFNGYGIVLEGTSSGWCDGNRVTGCSIESNNTYGVLFNGNSGRCSHNLVKGCVVRGNGMAGFRMDGQAAGNCVGNWISECVVACNGGEAFNLSGSSGAFSGNRISGCRLYRNTTRGFFCTTISGCWFDNNHITGPDFKGGASFQGFSFSGGADNLVTENTLVGPTMTQVVATPQVYGPWVTASGALSTNGVAAHPWANFSFQ